MDFTTLPVGTKVIWDSPEGRICGFISYIDQDDQPIKVDFGGYYRWFTSYGRYNPNDDNPSLQLAEPAVNTDVSATTHTDVSNALLPDHEVWLRFASSMVASDDWNVRWVIKSSDELLEAYKARFQ